MFVLDTNIISELRKIRAGRTSPVFAKWASEIEASSHFLSTTTILELERGILRLESKDPKQAWLLRQWLSDFVLPQFRNRILPVTTEIAQRAAYLLERTSIPSDEDALIAATAYIHNMGIVTRNTKHFAGAGVRILNPWEPQ
jgi:predicted nucleic acid-binding protein